MWLAWATWSVMADLRCSKLKLSLPLSWILCPLRLFDAFWALLQIVSLLHLCTISRTHRRRWISVPVENCYFLPVNYVVGLGNMIGDGRFTLFNLSKLFLPLSWILCPQRLFDAFWGLSDIVSLFHLCTISRTHHRGHHRPHRYYQWCLMSFGWTKILLSVLVGLMVVWMPCLE